MDATFVQTAITKITELAISYGPKLLLAIGTLIIGLWVIKAVVKLFSKVLKKSNFDKTLRPYLSGIVGTLLKVMLVISVAGMIGIETTSFIAVLGAAGLAVGMALQGSLGNFAGGVLILIFKPFKVGDYIVAQDVEGVVQGISIFATTLNSLDNKKIIVPNGPLSGGTIQNYTAEELRRVDMTFGVSYNDDIDKSRSAIKEALAKIPQIVSSPGTDIFVTELADSSVNFAVRPWCKHEHYWDVYFAAHENVKKVMDDKGISIPFPQQDVHHHNQPSA